MKILLLGANGQVGRALRGPLAALGEVTCATRDGMLDGAEPCLPADLADASSLAHALESAHADIIVNAAAYTTVDRAEDEPALADRINHLALAGISDWAVRHDALVVHYSTDYVFDGSALQAWHEDDTTAPLGVYGRSKRDGEIALRASGARHLILRTAWVYAARGHNFLRTMLRLAGERSELRVVADQIGAPTPAHWIAAATVQVLRRLQVMNEADRTRALGTYHLTASSHCSWHAFASAIVERAATVGLIAKAPRVLAIPGTDYPTRAQRPAWSVLDTRKLALVFGIQLPDWEQGLNEVIDELVQLDGETT